MGARRPPRRGRPFGGGPRPGVLGGNFQDILDQLREERGGRGGIGIRPPRDRDIVIDDGPGMGGPGIRPPRDQDIVIDDGPRPPRRRRNRGAQERRRRRAERMKRRAEIRRKRKERMAERRKRRKEAGRSKGRRNLPEDMPGPVSRRFAPGEEPN